jgi:hypothetical protein
VTTGIGKNIDLYIDYFSEKQHNKMAIVSRVLFFTGLKAIRAKPSEPEFFIWYKTEDKIYFSIDL